MGANLDFDCDALIVGGGPTGMSAALGLLAAGHSVHLIDKHEHGLGFSRAILVNSSTLALLEPHGVAANIAKRGQPIRALAIRGKNGVVVSGHVEEPNASGIHPILLPQLETEDCLREALAAHGVAVERPAELKTFVQDADGVTATLSANGQSRPFRAKYLIGADGFHSRVREGLGVPFQSIGPDMKMYGVDAVMTPPFTEDVNIWLLDEGAAIAFRLGERLVRFASTSRAAFAALGFEGQIEAKTWESDFDAHFAQAERYGEGRVWLAGDATHVHSPVGGRGMNMGIADGLRLARAIHDGDFAAYQSERKAVAEPWVRLNQRMTSVAGLTGPLGELARLAARGALRAAYLVEGESLARTLFKRIAVG